MQTPVLDDFFSGGVRAVTPLDTTDCLPPQAYVDVQWPWAVSAPGVVPRESGQAVRLGSDLTFERCGSGRYLQVDFHAPGNGTLSLIDADGAVVDTAEAPAGWAYVGLDADAIEDGSGFTLRFEGDGDIDGALIGRARFADDWGFAQRRRLPCYQPFEMMGIGTDFDAWPCCARQWMRGDQRVGNTREHSVTELWNAPTYQAIRQSFLEGDFARHCREDVCPRLATRLWHHAPNREIVKAVNDGDIVMPGGPSNANHDIDRGCNLACTMCRTDKILPDKANVAQGLKDIRELAETGSLKALSMSGAGEITAMREIVHLLESDILSSRGVHISVTSNLTGFTPAFWERTRHNDWLVLAASIDGASKETYESVRIGGNWDETLAAMKFAGELRQSGQIHSLTWQYTVQRSTIEDVVEAIRLSKALGFDAIRFIAQLGALPGTDGNIFEDADMDALDRLYDLLDGVGAFDDQRILTSELGIRDRTYRNAATRIGIAQNVFDRSHWSLVKAKTGAPDANVAKTVGILERLHSDITAGVTPPPDHLSPHHAAFVRQLLALYPTALQRSRDWLFRRQTGNAPALPDALAHWLKTLLRLPATAPERQPA